MTRRGAITADAVQAPLFFRAKLYGDLSISVPHNTEVRIPLEKDSDYTGVDYDPLDMDQGDGWILFWLAGFWLLNVSARYGGDMKGTRRIRSGLYDGSLNFLDWTCWNEAVGQDEEQTSNVWDGLQASSIFRVSVGLPRYVRNFAWQQNVSAVNVTVWSASVYALYLGPAT